MLSPPPYIHFTPTQTHQNSNNNKLNQNYFSSDLCSSPMSNTSKISSAKAAARQPSRLQRRAPASLKISPVSSWNVAIPLLSPLASSPASSDVMAEREESRQEQRQSHSVEVEKPVFKRWQHPAAPFCYDPAPRVPSFVPV